MGSAYDTLVRDISYAARALRTAPGFTATFVLSVALGVGANGAVFALVDRLLLSAPSDVQHPRQLHRLIIRGRDNTGADRIVREVGGDDITDFKAAIAPIARIEGYRLRIDHGGPSGMVTGVAFTTPGYFDILGVKPSLGRFYTAADDTVAQTAPVAVLSHHEWMVNHGGDTGILQQTILINGIAFRVIGVAPAGFDGVDANSVDVWAPANAINAQRASRRQLGDTVHAHDSIMRPSGPPRDMWRHYQTFTPLVRIASASDQGRVAALLTAIYRHSSPQDRLYDSSATVGLESIVQLRGTHQVAGIDYRRVSMIVAMATIAVTALLLSCANVTMIMLLRSLRRRQELGIRLALGMSRGRLVLQLATESVVLSAIAALFALAVSWLGARTLRTVLFAGVHWGPAILGGRTVGLALIASVAIGLLAGVLPAWQAGKSEASLRSLQGGAWFVRRTRTQQVLIALQIGVCVAIVTNTALFVTSAYRATAYDFGLDYMHLLSIDATALNATAAQNALPHLLDRVRELRSVRSASITDYPPVAPRATPEFIRMENGDSSAAALVDHTYLTMADTAFFHTAGIQLERGRLFDSNDRQGAPPVAIVNAAMEAAFWPAQNPIGRCFYIFRDKGPCITVVGTVNDTRARVDQDPPLRFFLPLDQSIIPYYMPPGFPAYSGYTIIVRTKAIPTSAEIAAVTDLARSTIPWSRPLVATAARDDLDPEIRPLRATALLLSMLAVLTLVLVGVGLFGAAGYELQGRSRELGVRMALGAGPLQIVRLLGFDLLRTMALGLLIGFALTFASSGLVRSLLVGTPALEPPLLLAAALLVGAAVAGGCAMPLARSLRIDPRSVLE